jgi:hypothetical protein
VNTGILDCHRIEDVEAGLVQTMKYTIYEDPITHQFAHLPLPSRFLDGDRLPAVVTDRWFESRDAAIAALSELLDRDEGATADAAVPTDAAAPPIDPSPRPVLWFQH